MTDGIDRSALLEPKWQRLYNLIASLAHPKGDHRQNDLEDEAHDLIRELRVGEAGAGRPRPEPETCFACHGPILGVRVWLGETYDGVQKEWPFHELCAQGAWPLYEIRRDQVGEPAVDPASGWQPIASVPKDGTFNRSPAKEKNRMSLMKPRQPRDRALQAARDALKGTVCECGHSVGNHRRGPSFPLADADGTAFCADGCACRVYRAVRFRVVRAKQGKG